MDSHKTSIAFHVVMICRTLSLSVNIKKRPDTIFARNSWLTAKNGGSEPRGLLLIFPFLSLIFAHNRRLREHSESFEYRRSLFLVYNAIVLKVRKWQPNNTGNASDG